MEKLTPQPPAKAHAKPQISIIGFGRFGRLWASTIKSDFHVKVYDQSKATLEQASSLGVEASPLDDALAADVIFYCVPISEFATTIAHHATFFKATSASKLLIDLLSVKVHAKEIFKKDLPGNIEAMLCHPLFGPDSVNEFGLAGQRIVIEQFRSSDQKFNFWKNYFINLKLEVLEMTAEEHDQQIASSQALTHLVGRILNKMNFSASEIDTSNSRKLLEVTKQVGKDEYQLFLDLQRYNPYTKVMREQFAQAQADLNQQIDAS